MPEVAVTDLMELTSIPQMYEMAASRFSDMPAMLDPHSNPPTEYTFRCAQLRFPAKAN